MGCFLITNNSILRVAEPYPFAMYQLQFHFLIKTTYGASLGIIF